MGLSTALSTTGSGRATVISSVWETISFAVATAGAGVSTIPGGGTQVCADALTAIMVQATSANRVKVIFRSKLICAYWNPGVGRKTEGRAQQQMPSLLHSAPLFITALV